MAHFLKKKKKNTLSYSCSTDTKLHNVHGVYCLISHGQRRHFAAVYFFLLIGSGQTDEQRSHKNRL